MPPGGSQTRARPRTHIFCASGPGPYEEFAFELRHAKSEPGSKEKPEKKTAPIQLAPTLDQADLDFAADTILANIRGPNSVLYGSAADAPEYESSGDRAVSLRERPSHLLEGPNPACHLCHADPSHAINDLRPR